MTSSVFSGWCSYSFLSRRARPSHASVRSTTHLRGRRTNPVASAGRWTISKSIPYLCWDQATRVPRYPWSAHPFTSAGQAARARPSTQRAPSASDMSAVSTATASRRPALSTTTCRFRPVTFLAPVVAPRPPRFGGLHTLAIDHERGRLRRSAPLLAHLLDQHVMELFPGPVP